MNTIAGSSRRARRSVGWYALREYATGALWVLPSIAALVAVVTGYVVSHLDVRPGTLLDRLAFQGTADDARSLLVAVSSTVVTVIALVLGLTVVALQLSSTQFSPRVLRNFLRDRPTQVVLSAFIATFVYSAAGLFTVGLEGGSRTENYPRLAVSGSIALLFVSLGMVVYYADHLVHSIQIDAINRRIERNTHRAMASLDPGATDAEAPRVPDWATPILARRSGYVQTVHPHLLLPLAEAGAVTVCLRPRVGQHVAAGTVLGWVWPTAAGGPAPDRVLFTDALNTDVRIGFERTLEQDVAFGIRQQIDVACKALSPAVNDPYTAVQALDHLSVVFCALALRPLGATVLTGRGAGIVIVPGNVFADYLFFVSGLIGRYGLHDPTVLGALARLFRNCAEVLPAGSPRLDALEQAVEDLEADAERGLTRARDRAEVAAVVRTVRHRLAQQRGDDSVA